MNNIVVFPTKARIASNDSNPWLSSDSTLAEKPVKVESEDAPIYAKQCRVVDKLSGVEYIGYVIVDEEKPRGRAGLFVLAVIGWLILCALV